MNRVLILTALGGLVFSAAALAQDSGSGTEMQKHMQQKGSHMGGPAQQGSGAHAQHGAAAKGDAGPSSTAFRAANDKMHAGMDIAFTGNADVDFVRGMIPHHQGAIDMAKVVLAHGKNAKIKKLAEDIIKAQEGEIAMMNDWLKANAK